MTSLNPSNGYTLVIAGIDMSYEQEILFTSSKVCEGSGLSSTDLTKEDKYHF